MRRVRGSASSLQAAQRSAVAAANRGDAAVTEHLVISRAGDSPLALARCGNCGAESRRVADERLLTWWELLHDCGDELERLRRANIG